MGAVIEPQICCTIKFCRLIRHFEAMITFDGMLSTHLRKLAVYHPWWNYENLAEHLDHDICASICNWVYLFRPVCAEIFGWSGLSSCWMELCRLAQPDSVHLSGCWYLIVSVLSIARSFVLRVFWILATEKYCVWKWMECCVLSGLFVGYIIYDSATLLPYW